MGRDDGFTWRWERPWIGRDFGLAVRVFDAGWTRILEQSSGRRARRAAGADFWGCAGCQAAPGLSLAKLPRPAGQRGKQTAARGAMLLAKMPDKSSNPFQVKRAGTGSKV